MLKKIMTVLCLAFITSISYAQDVTVVYSTRAPLITKTETEIAGTVGKISSDVLKDAGFNPIFVELPLARQLDAIEQDTKPVCGINYFKRPEREKIGNFTNAVLYDQPIGVLTTATNLKTLSYETFKELTTDSSLKFARKIETSYGAYLDKLIKDNNVKVVESVEENSSRVRQIGLNRADYMFIQYGEFSYIVEQEKLQPTDFVHIQMKDSPPINTRHFLCSRKVTPDMIARMNTSIAKLVRQ